jgi:hypothetical protein
LSIKSPKRRLSRKSHLHLIPLARTFAAVDSIRYFYEPNDPIACLTCVQITMTDDHHDVVVSGLSAYSKVVSNWFQIGTLEALPGRPKRTRRWRFLFLVPSGNASAFESQRLKGDTNRGEWAGKVYQYVLGLEDQTMFGRRSDSSVQNTIMSQGATGTVLNICLGLGVLKNLVYGFR